MTAARAAKTAKNLQFMRFEAIGFPFAFPGSQRTGGY
jgi:hypothetical protein